MLIKVILGLGGSVYSLGTLLMDVEDGGPSFRVNRKNFQNIADELTHPLPIRYFHID